jgi:preprotein translocase subunit SecE
MAKTSPQQFVQQVRQEVSKVTWPTRRETLVTTLMVFIMVALAALFFFVIDEAINFSMRILLGFGG